VVVSAMLCRVAWAVVRNGLIVGLHAEPRVRSGRYDYFLGLN
jgi:hypothetical protein